MLTRSHILSIYAGVRVHMRAYLNTYTERHAHPYLPVLREWTGV